MMGGDGQLFLQIGLVIIVASVLSLAFARMRQPMIVAYMVAGLLVGPGVLGLVESSGMFEALSQVGVAFLLFLVGVKLDWRQMKEVGPVAIVAGVVEVAVGSMAGY
ncbi:MAG: cation:proton antiporter, partial [Patescibacteria group bacterium]